MGLTWFNKSGAPQVVLANDGRLTISVTIQTKRRGAQKLVTLPNGETGMGRPREGEPTPL